MIKSIIFDFDGVIVESSKLKYEAFFEVLRPFIEDNEKEEAIAAYLSEHAGLSRHIKISHICRQILKLPFDETKVNQLIGQFGDLVFKRVANAPYVHGALEFLNENYGKYDFFIVSGTPQEELENILKMRAIDHYFKKVYGSPCMKDEIILQILKKNRLKPSEALFVGDALTDYHAADNTGVFFIARITDESPDPLRNTRFKIGTLDELPNLIDHIHLSGELFA